MVQTGSRTNVVRKKHPHLYEPAEPAINPIKISTLFAFPECTIPKRNAHHSGISLARLHHQPIMRVNP
jgi:hypothetical protein